MGLLGGALARERNARGAETPILIARKGESGIWDSSYAAERTIAPPIHTANTIQNAGSLTSGRSDLGLLNDVAMLRPPAKRAPEVANSMDIQITVFPPLSTSALSLRPRTSLETMISCGNVTAL